MINIYNKITNLLNDTISNVCTYSKKGVIFISSILLSKYTSIINNKRCNTIIFRIIHFISIYFLWVCIHNISSNLYTYFCAHLSIYGIFQSMFISQSPHCRILHFISYTGVDIIYSMWISLSVWMSSKIISYFPNALTKYSNNDILPMYKLNR